MKIYIVNPNDTPLAHESTELLEDIQSSLTKRGYTTTRSAADADAIIINEKTSFKEWRYIKRLVDDPAIGQWVHKTYTINTDDCATGLLKGVYTSIPRKRLNQSIHAVVPYARYPNEYVLSGTNPSQEKKYLASWRGNTDSNPGLRCKLAGALEGLPDFKIETTDSWLNHGSQEKQTYVNLILSSKFSLCPGGWAPASFRIYESMALGIPPVIVADQCVLPDGPDWESCSIRIEEKCISKIPGILKERSTEHVTMGSAARREWERYFSPEIVADYYTDRLLGCIGNSPGASTIKAELSRMRSFQTYWGNRWTMPQRIYNNIRRRIKRSGQRR